MSKISLLDPINPDGSETVVVLKNGVTKRAQFGAIVGAAINGLIDGAKATLQGFVTSGQQSADRAEAAATKVTIANDEGRLLLFVDGSDDQIELGAFLADGTFAPNKWPPLIANLVLRTGTDVDDGSGDLLQILDTSEDGIFLMRITENGLVKGKFDGVDPVAVAAAINGSATALARADAALAKSSAGSRTQLLRTQALTARRNNRFTKSPLASPPTIAIAAGGATPAGLPRGYTGGSGAFTYLGGVPIGGDSIGVHAVSFPSGGNLGSGRGALHWAAKWCTDASKFAIRVASDQTSGFFRLWADDRLASDFMQIDATANGAHLITVDFGTREPRTIRFDCCGNSSFQGLFVGANDTVWSIGQSDIVRAVWAADSFGEGFSSRGGNFPTYTPGLAWPIVAGAHLGWENVRQAAIGGTGYLYDGGAGNGKWNFNAHKADWLTFNPDVLVFAGSVNNGGLEVNAEADQALLTWREARAGLPSVPIIIMGLMTDPTYVTLAATQESLLAARFATFADANSLFVPIATDPEGPWVKGDGTMAAPNGRGNADIYKGTSVTADRTHLNPTGDLYAGERSAEKIRAWLANR